MSFEDKIIWSYSKDEKFFVRSAYYVANMRKRSNQGEPSNADA